MNLTAPQTVEELMAEAKTADATRRTLEDQAAQAKARCTRLRDELHRRLKEEGLSEFRSEHGLIRISKKKTASVRDWDVLAAWLADQGLPPHAIFNKAIRADVLHDMAVKGGVPMPDGVELGEIENPRFTPSKD